MADNLLLPVCLDRIVNANGVPVSGARVFVYDAGTTDLKNVYTNIALTSAAANPIVGDDGGYIPARYIGTGSYKLVIKDPVGSLDPGDWVTLKTEDNLPGALNTAPFSVSAAEPVTPEIATAVSRVVAAEEVGSIVDADPTGGNVVITLPDPADHDGEWVGVRHNGTAGQVTVEYSSVLATLYTTDEAVTLYSNGVAWKVRSRASVAVIDRVPDPQGYLTLVPVASDAINPIPTSDQASKTSVFYRPFTGDRVPIYNGMTFLPRQFAELELVLVSQHEASGIYDVFADWSGTAVRIGTGPKWSTVTAGSGARGSGGSTTELARVQGRLVNANAITLRNGGTTWSLAANRGTYLGSIYIDGSAGQCSCHVAYGQSRKWGVWNAYNRRPIVLKVGDATASWTYNSSTVRAARNDANNKGTVFCGLAEEFVRADRYQAANVIPAAGDIRGGIGWNVTNAFSGLTLVGVNANTTTATVGHSVGSYTALPFIGINDATACEAANTNGGSSSNNTFLGTELNCLLTLTWRG